MYAGEDEKTIKYFIQVGVLWRSSFLYEALRLPKKLRPPPDGGQAGSSTRLGVDLLRQLPRPRERSEVPDWEGRYFSGNYSKPSRLAGSADQQSSTAIVGSLAGRSRLGSTLAPAACRRGRAWRALLPTDAEFQGWAPGTLALEPDATGQRHAGAACPRLVTTR